MNWWTALLRWLGWLPDEPAEPALPGPTEEDPTPDLPPQDEPTMEPDVPYEPTILNQPLPNFYTGWTRKPWAIVVHYSAGYTAESCHETLERRGLSVHATIERDGTIWREVSDDNRGIHAGYGRWGGQSNMNHHAFGFEIANMGPMDGRFTGNSPHFVYDPEKYDVIEINPMADGTIQYRNESYTDSSGKKKTNCVLTRTRCASFPDHRQEYTKKIWSIFPDEQLQAVFWLMYQWVLKHDILPENIVGHEHVTPGRKQDPSAERADQGRPVPLCPHGAGRGRHRRDLGTTHRSLGPRRTPTVSEHLQARGCRRPIRQLPPARQRPSTGPRLRPGSTMKALLSDHVLPVRRVELPVSTNNRKAIDLLPSEVRRRSRSLALDSARRAATCVRRSAPAPNECTRWRRNALLGCPATVTGIFVTLRHGLAPRIALPAAQALVVVERHSPSVPR
jgi:hypothetical protein